MNFPTVVWIPRLARKTEREGLNAAVKSFDAVV
jgi:hypothetical protein